MAGLAGVRKKIDEVLRNAPAQVSVDEQGDYALRVEDIVVYARPVEWNGRAVVRIWSISNVGMRLDGELAQFLLRENAKMLIGGFRLDERGPAVMATHSILADDLSPAELAVATVTMALAARKLGPEIKSRFGGRLFIES